MAEMEILTRKAQGIAVLSERILISANFFRAADEGAAARARLGRAGMPIPTRKGRLVCMRRYCLLLLVLLLGSFSVGQSQETSPQLKPRPVEPASPPRLERRINLDVQVTDKKGNPIRGLQEQDFTLLDDKQPKKVAAFRAVDAASPATAEPVEIYLVVDAVNTNFGTVAYERAQVKAFLQQNGGKLAWPVALVVFSDRETKIQGGFSRDGNATAALFDQIETGLRTNTRSQGFWGAQERLDMSLKALGELVTQAKTQPGRKLIIWFSRGWPMFSPRITLTEKEQQQIFSSIVADSAELRQDRITLYSVDPGGTEGDGVYANTQYDEFEKGVKSATGAYPGDLGLQVLAMQSGGRVFYLSNDMVGEIANCVADANAYYVLSFDSPPADRQDEYHALQVKVDKGGATVRTQTGYYAHP
jgi:VWFA-related protein